MVATLQIVTAVLYFVACAASGAGFALARPAWNRVAVGVLAAGALAHGASFSLLHTLDPPPPLTHLPSALSFMAWIGTLGFLLLVWRAKLAGLVVLVAPMSLLGVLASLSAGRGAVPEESLGAGSLPHAHVLLASAGLALLGLAGLAGALFLVEHTRLKRKRPPSGGGAWPSLEALDRAGAFAVAAGFPLLTLGVLYGALWQREASGLLWSGSAHETFCLVAWAIYGALAFQRFGARLPARRCAMSALAGFGLLGCAVLGVELLT